MIIGVPKEIKKEEYRVGLTPEGVAELKCLGHAVLVEEGAGAGSGFTDGEFMQADADIVDKAALFRNSQLIIKVKEPMPDEYKFFRSGQALFTFLHLAANPDLTGMLLARNVSAFAYETLTVDGALPLLIPMSEIAGRMAPLMASFYLQKQYGGDGVFPGGAVGADPARCVILGAGTVGTNAARIALALGLDTVVLNKGLERLRKLDEMFMGRLKTMPIDHAKIEDEVRDADIVICAILVPGAKTPVLITRPMLKEMKRGAIIVDVSVDQGGAVETARPTTHADPVYEVDGVIHYCVSNMPGAYPRTATLALTNATLPYVIELAKEGSIEGAIARSDVLRSALNVYRGAIVNPALAQSMGVQPADIDALIAEIPQV